jgi:hypothetical protein
VVRAAAAGAALAVAGSGVGGALRAAGVGRPSLTARRRRTYRALVDALGRASPESLVDPARAAFAAGELDTDYALALAPTRQAIDAVLDGLEQAGGRDGFARLAPPARVALLRALASDPRPSRCDLAGRAVALAAAPFHPPGGEFHPTPVIL